MNYTRGMRPEKVDLTSLVIYAKQAMAEITQKTYLILIKSELTSRNNNFIFMQC